MLHRYANLSILIWEVAGQAAMFFLTTLLGSKSQSRVVVPLSSTVEFHIIQRHKLTRGSCLSFFRLVHLHSLGYDLALPPRIVDREDQADREPAY